MFGLRSLIPRRTGCTGVKPVYELFCIDHDVVLTDLVKRIFQVLLDFVEAHEHQRKQHRHDVGKAVGIVSRDVCEIRSILGRRNGNEKIAERPQRTRRTRRTILIYVFDLFKGQQHF